MPRRRRLPLRRSLGILLVVAALGLWVGPIRRLRTPAFPRGLVLHHSASPPVLHGKPVTAGTIAAWHRGRGLSTVYKGRRYDVGYHYLILGDGTVEVGRPEGCVGRHATYGNDCLGICLVGDFSSQDNPDGRRGPIRPTPAQLDALVRLCRELLDRYHFPVSSIRTHAQVDGDTECPGDRFPFQEVLVRVGSTRLRRGGASGGKVSTLEGHPRPLGFAPLGSARGRRGHPELACPELAEWVEGRPPMKACASKAGQVGLPYRQALDV